MLDILRSSFNFTASLQEIYSKFVDLTKNQRGSIRSAASRLTKKGSIVRIEKGVYKLERFFRKFQHTKRVHETHVVKPINKFDFQEIEATSTGLVPITSDENFIIEKFLLSKRVPKALRKLFNKIADRFEIVINPLLIDEAMRILATQDPNHPIFLAMTAGVESSFQVEWKISGSEFLTDTESKFDEIHEVEVNVINAQGRNYIFDGEFFVKEKQFE